MLLDHLVRGFPADPAFHGLHHDGGGHQERQVAGGFRSDHRFIRIHLVEDGEVGLEHPIEGEKRIRQHHPADDRATHIALVPLVPGETGGHREVAFQDYVKTVHALARAGIHFVRHGAGAGLAGGKALAGRFVPGHQAQGFAERGGSAGELRQNGNDPQVQRARIHLADVAPLLRDAEVGDGAFLQIRNFSRIPAEERKLVHLRSDRTFQPAHRVTRDDILQHGETGKQLLTEHGDAFPQSGRLGGDVVSARGEHHIIPLLRPLAHPSQARHHFFPNHQQAPENLKLLDVFR